VFAWRDRVEDLIPAVEIARIEGASHMGPRP
jgi:hypothetical protein